MNAWEAAPLIDAPAAAQGARGAWEDAPEIETPNSVDDIMAAAKSAGAMEKLGDPSAMTGQAPDPSFVERAQMRVSGLDRRQFPDLPIFEANHADPGQSFKYALGTLLAATPDAERDVALKQLPGVNVTKDSFGNYIADFNGEKGYINPAGLTGRDLAKSAALVASFAPIGRLASLATAGRGFLGRMLAQAGAGAGSSVLIDLGAGQLGSEQDVSPSRAIASATGGIVGESAGSLLNYAASHLSPGVQVLNQAGQLTPEAASVLREVGFDPADASPEFLQSLQQSVNRSGMTPAAARSAAASEFDVPLSRGQALQDPSQLGWEAQARNDAKGEAAGNRVRGLDSQQDAAIASARQGMAQRLAGGQSLAEDPLSAAARTTEGVRSRAQDLNSQIDNAYAIAADPIRNARVDFGAVRGMESQIHAALQNGDVVVDDLVPATRAALGDIRNFTQGADANLQPGDSIVDVNLRGMEQLRRRIANRFDQAANPADRRALGIVRRTFDDGLADAVDSSLMSGDPSALDAIRQARSLRSAYSLNFAARNPQDDAGRIIDRIVNQNVTDREVSNWLYGASQVGLKGESVRLAQRVRGVLGDQSPEWQAIREGAWRKVTETPRGTADYTPQEISDRLSNFVNGDGRGLAEQLFNRDELAAMRRFAFTMRSATRSSSGGGRSRINYDVVRALNNGLANIAGLAGFNAGGAATGLAAREAVSVGMGLRDALRARAAVQGAPIARRPASGLFPVSGGAFGYLNAPSPASGR